MSIDPARSAGARPRGVDATLETAPKQKAERTSTNAPDDQLYVVDAPRVPAAHSTGTALPPSEARLAEVRARLDDGLHTRDSVVRQVADRILESGDL